MVFLTIAVFSFGIPLYLRFSVYFHSYSKEQFVKYIPFRRIIGTPNISPLFFIVLLALAGCGSSGDTGDHAQKQMEEEAQRYIDSIEKSDTEAEKWIQDNIIPKNDQLISFRKEFAPEDSLRREHDGPWDTKKISPITVKTYPDSIVASFYKMNVAQARGNIDLTGDNIRLLYGDVYAPTKMYAGAYATFRFVYTIKNTAETRSRKIIAESTNLLRKP
ncbi:MAG: hypothetical protein ACJ77K_10270 [Bacteroidia bacterium]